MSTAELLQSIGLGVVILACGAAAFAFWWVIGWCFAWVMDRVFTPWYARRHGYTMEEWNELDAQFNEWMERR